MAKVGIFGGSGVEKIDGLQAVDELSLLTPFGEPSCNYIIGKLEGVDVVFLPRHGHGHKISPSEINYRANVFGMKKLGVDAIISISAVGSLKENIKPRDFVVPDQFIDRAIGIRATTFFGEGVVAHVSFANPVAVEVRDVLIDCIKELGLPFHEKGTYLNMEGPQFSTKAESLLYRSWGADIIGMTNATEAKLAREAEISYATLATVTDYDCWHPGHDAVTVEMILDHLKHNVENARKILRIVIPRLGALKKFSAASALKEAIVTSKEAIPERKKRELEILIGKYVS
jgi:5'-methylthioadenosine phosphorylase